MVKDTKNLIISLDIGTSKVVAMVAHVLPDGYHEIIGIGQAESSGLKKGVIVDIEATITSIRYALEKAELMADCRIRSVHAGISGSHIHSFNSTGMVVIKDREVRKADVLHVIETAKAINIPADQKFLHAISQEFIVDDQEGIHAPIGMTGIRLEVKSHIITGAASAIQNIVKCIRRCKLEVSELILHPLASASAVLTPDERKLGVVLVDIGGGTTDVVIFSENSVRHTAVIPIAGDQITNDIAIALRTPIGKAEEIKLRYGIAKHSMVDPSEMLEVPSLGDQRSRTLSRQVLVEVIEARVEELFSLINQVIHESGCEEKLSGGIVLTGGSVVMPGIIELAQNIFFKPTRLGTPNYHGQMTDTIQHPRNSTALGLLLEAKKKHLQEHTMLRQAGPVRVILQRIKEWFIRNF